jgi:hypothetical protein
MSQYSRGKGICQVSQKENQALSDRKKKIFSGALKNGGLFFIMKIL